MSRVINKGDFTKKFAEANGLSINKATNLVNSFLGLVEGEVVAGNKVNFTGFGQFSPVVRAAREGRNPGTGEPIHIPATKTVKFTAGKKLKDAVK
jgi:DNA-binding protein HU-beta